MISVCVAAGLSCSPVRALQDDGLDVEVTVEGIDKASLRKTVREVSAIHRAEEGTYTALASIRRAVETDAEQMHAFLESQGYYAARVDPDIRRTEGEVAITFTVDTGPRFEVTDYRITYQNEIEAPRPQTLKAAGIRGKTRPTGAELQEIEAKLLSYLLDDGFPATEPLGRRVEADFSTGKAVVVLPFRTGPLSRYGTIRVAGTERVEDTYVRQLRTFDEGEVYRRSDVEEYREALAETGLFSEIQVEPAPPLADGVTDLVVTVSERDQRTLAGGVSFGTDIGPGVALSWEHRNFLGRNELALARLGVARPLQELELIFEKPRPRLPGSWRLGALFQNEDTDAFEAQSVTLGASLNKYWFERDLQTTAGIRYLLSIIDDTAGARDEPPPPEGEDTTRTFQSVSLPLAAIWNNETDELNPTDGFRARFLVEPYFGSTQFNRIALGGASRIGLGDGGEFQVHSTILAARALIGATYGADRQDIPATERFYAGGGGSIRGYGFQEAGPLNVVRRDGALLYRDGTPFAFEVDEDGAVTDDPIVPIGSIGGASTFEANAELRQKITDNIQLAVFADGGTVFESQTPDFTGDLLVGAGAGVRYFTPIGPIRLDVAVPLNRRKISAERTFVNDDGETVTENETVFQDDFIGVYIALGQPF